GPGHLRLRDDDLRHRGHRRAAAGTGAVGEEGDRPDRDARRAAVRTVAAEDALGQDHAADLAQDRRGGCGEPGGYEYAGGSERGGGFAKEPPAVTPAIRAEAPLAAFGRARLRKRPSGAPFLHEGRGARRETSRVHF